MLRHTTPDRATARAAALAFGMILFAACSDHSSPSGPDVTSGPREFHGTLSIAYRAADGDIQAAERLWTATATEGDRALVSPSRVTALLQDVSRIASLPADQRPAPVPVLAVREDHHLARWKGSRPSISQFTEGGRTMTLIVERDADYGPPNQLTIFDGQSPAQLIRFEWLQDGKYWIAARTAVTIWKDGVPASQLVARINGTGRELASTGASAVADLLNAGTYVKSLVLPVLSSLLLPSPVQAQALYFRECRNEWLAIFKVSTTMAITVAAMGSLAAWVDLILKYGFVPQLFDYVDSLFDLLDCRREQEAAGTRTGSTTTPPPPLPSVLMSDEAMPLPAFVQQGLDRIEMLCARGTRDFALCG